MTQVTTFVSRCPVFDRHGVPVCVGNRIRAKVCVGRYGQTRIIEGVVEGEHSPGGRFYIRLETGSLYPVTVESKNGKAVCYHKHIDYEHGHERWAEVLEEG
jgi:hypothetical protein